MASESPGGMEKFHSSLGDLVENSKSLEDLVENSKSLITKLTRLDDKNDIHAREIIGAIREITSITKTFCYTYEKVDEKIRKTLYELRLTWEGIFSRTRLYNLDIQVHQLDPTWPIITPDKKSSPNINTRENKRRFNRAMIVGVMLKDTMKVYTHWIHSS